MQWLIYTLIGGVAGWLVAWATDKSGAKMVKPIVIGAAGALAGAGSIVLLAQVAPMIGAALGSLALLNFVSKRGSDKTLAVKK